jgi:hypothetical protein
MNTNHISLFGSLNVHCGDHCPIQFDANRAQELFCSFLLSLPSSRPRKAGDPSLGRWDILSFAQIPGVRLSSGRA